MLFQEGLVAINRFKVIHVMSLGIPLIQWYKNKGTKQL